MKPDRFDLEQQIFNCWSVTEDFDLLCQREDVPDNIKQALGALKVVYGLRFEQLFNTFEEIVCRGDL